MCGSPDFSLSLRWSKCEASFEELDANKSGTLDGEKFAGLVKKMNLDHGEGIAQALEKVKLELHAGTDGAVSKENYKAWFHEKVHTLEESPYDILFQLTKSHASMWWLWILLLKAVISLLYTLGVGGEFRFHVWFHAVLAVSLSLLVVKQPYLERRDHYLEVATMLSLIGMSHISSIFANTVWELAY